MDSFQSDKISWETPPFSDVQENAIKEIKEVVTDLMKNEEDPRIKEIYKKMDSSQDSYERIELCSQINILEPKNFLVDTVKATEYSNLNENEKAEESFKTAIKKSDRNHYFPSYHYGLFLCSQKTRRVDGVKELFHAEKLFTTVISKLKSLSDEELTEKKSTQIIKSIKDMNMLNYALGCYLFSMGVVKGGLAYLERTFSIDPDSNFDKRPLNDARKVIKMCIDGVQECNFELTKDENNVNVLFSKSNFLLKQEEYTEAKECLLKILLIDKNNPNTAIHGSIKEVNQLLMQIESMENRPFYPK
jgi:tetratricopeptide (TPR) repeat protein